MLVTCVFLLFYLLFFLHLMQMAQFFLYMTKMMFSYFSIAFSFIFAVMCMLQMLENPLCMLLAENCWSFEVDLSLV